MKIGITGSTGVLGKILCNKLREQKISVSCFVGDVCDKNTIREWLVSHDFQAIMHFAAMVPTVSVVNNPLKAYEVNVSGTINLLSEIQRSGQKPWFFYPSSSHVYSSSDEKLQENDEIRPYSVYGSTKYMAEKICTDFAKSESCQFRICCGRIFSFYHETQEDFFLYPKVIKRLQEENLSNPFFVYNADGVRDFLNAEEVIEIILKLMEKNVSDVVNIASGKPIKIRDFVQQFSDIKLNIVTDENKPESLIPDISKLRSLLDLK